MASCTYDGNGNTLSRTGTSIPGGVQLLDYDEFHMPYRVTNGGGDTKETLGLEYDASGSRLVKTK